MLVPREADQALRAAERLLPGIVAAYLHGSAVAGGLRPQSDVDLLLVLDRPLTDQQRLALAAGMMVISGRPGSGAARPLELIAFLRGDLEALAYPARSEFAYGEWLRDSCEAGAVPRPSTDPEFTLLLAQARIDATALKGPPPAELLPRVGVEDIRRASRDLLPLLMQRLKGDERNVLLTLARMWRTSVTKEFVPKDVAALWAMPRLSPHAAAVLEQARRAYLDGASHASELRLPDIRRAADELHRQVLAAL